MDFPPTPSLMDDLKWLRSAIITCIHDELTFSCRGVFLVVFALVLVTLRHVFCWKKPKEQKKMLVIVCVPFIHAITSYVELHYSTNFFFGGSFFMLMDSIRECYVGLVIGMFLNLLYTYLNIDNEELSPRDLRRIITQRLICNFFPVTLIQPRYVRLTLDNLKFVKYFTWQFVAVRLVCSVLMIVLKLLEIYPVWLNWAFFLISSSSLSLALYTLFVFYKAYSRLLPLYTRHQFSCVKGIVFVCFWQGSVLRILGALGIIKSNHLWQQELQNNLVILEMLFFAIEYAVAYSPDKYRYAAHAPVLPIQQPVPKHKLADSCNKPLPSCING